MSDGVMSDLTDAFDRRLAILDKRGQITERDAAILVYERLRTAQSIVKALMHHEASEATLIALVVELSKEAARLHEGQGSRSIE